MENKVWIVICGLKGGEQSGIKAIVSASNHEDAYFKTRDLMEGLNIDLPIDYQRMYFWLQKEPERSKRQFRISWVEPEEMRAIEEKNQRFDLNKIAEKITETDRQSYIDAESGLGFNIFSSQKTYALNSCIQALKAILPEIGNAEHEKWIVDNNPETGEAFFTIETPDAEKVIELGNFDLNMCLMYLKTNIRWMLPDKKFRVIADYNPELINTHIRYYYTDEDRQEVKERILEHMNL